MSTPATAAATAFPSPFRRRRSSAIAPLPSSLGALSPCPPTFPLASSVAFPRGSRDKRLPPCLVAVTSDAPAAGDAEGKVGRRVRVTTPVTVYHVAKAPELLLEGMEGTVKQYVGVWKGKRITANFPFKVEFQLNVEGQDRPVRFFAHLREDEFEYLPEDS